MINERNAELGAEYAPLVENQMKVKHIAYGMKPQACLMPQTQATASLAHLDIRNSYYFLLATPKNAHRLLWRLPHWLEIISTHHPPIT